MSRCIYVQLYIVYTFKLQILITLPRGLPLTQLVSLIACDQGKIRIQLLVKVWMLRHSRTTVKLRKSDHVVSVAVCVRKPSQISIWVIAEYLRKHTGTGGLTDVGIASQAAESRANRTIKSKPISAGAFKRRPNPPNSEFRRAYERGDLPLSIYQYAALAPSASRLLGVPTHGEAPLFFSQGREEPHIVENSCDQTGLPPLLASVL
jgi:hypothetical protein